MFQSWEQTFGIWVNIFRGIEQSMSYIFHGFPKEIHRLAFLSPVHKSKNVVELSIKSPGHSPDIMTAIWYSGGHSSGGRWFQGKSWLHKRHISWSSHLNSSFGIFFVAPSKSIVWQGPRKSWTFLGHENSHLIFRKAFTSEGEITCDTYFIAFPIKFIIHLSTYKPGWNKHRLN